jgi:endo-cleaving rubber dioxygenase
MLQRSGPGPILSFHLLLFATLLLSTQPVFSAPDTLLDSKRGGSLQWDFCYGKPDDAVLPADPRTLVQPGVSDGRAVHFNAYWKECHLNPELVMEEGHPTTCGGLRERFYHGEGLMETGGPQVGALFAGQDPTLPEAAFGISTFSAEQFNQVWKIWGGFMFRPDNFDQLIAERYGSGFGESPNPYPLPGEDPNRTEGGSGKLPEMLTQMRNPDGSWSGRIGVTCHACHSGVAGSKDGKGPGVIYGGGSSLADLDLLLRDMLPLGYPASFATFANLNRSRGTNNASDINLAFLFPDEEHLTPEEVIGFAVSDNKCNW